MREYILVTAAGCGIGCMFVVARKLGQAVRLAKTCLLETAS